MTDLTIPRADLTPRLEAPESSLTLRIADTAAVHVTAALPLGPDADVVVEWRSAGATFDLDQLAARLTVWGESDHPREVLADSLFRELRDAGMRASSTDYTTGRQVQLFVDRVVVTWPRDDGKFTVEAPARAAR